MKKASYIFAAVVAAVTLTIWASTGFHTGWTQTSIPVTGVDEITGIEFTTYEEGFVAGVDVLGAGLGAAFGISALSLGIHKFRARKQS